MLTTGERRNYCSRLRKRFIDDYNDSRHDFALKLVDGKTIKGIGAK